MSQKSKRPPFIRRGQIFQAHGSRYEALANSRPLPGIVNDIELGQVLALDISEDSDDLPAEVVFIEEYTFVEAHKPAYSYLKRLHDKLEDKARESIARTYDEPKPIDMRSAFVEPKFEGAWSGLSPA